MSRPMTAVRAAALIGVLALVTAGCGSDDPAPGVTPNPSSTASAPGKAATEPEQTLPARWWTWAAGSPRGESPIADTTGEFCDQGQPDDVFFLAGTFGEEGVKRTCTVPAGKPVYFPLLNQVCLVEGKQSDAAALKGCELFGDARATLDGILLDAEEQTSGARFRFKPRRGNDLDLSAGDAVAWGIWTGPLELEPGEHTLEISAESDDFAVGVTYELTVK